MPLANFIRHLRLQFQFVLAPVFLLGYLLSGAALDGMFFLLFCLIHIGLYGGATAYNSYWDQDEGPVGGMKHPPPAGAWERKGGMALQWIAVAIMSWWGWFMALAGAAMVVMGIAYSHPRWRMKRRPHASLLMVTAGQGILPLLMGGEAGRVAGGQLQGALLAWVSCAAALIITGFYPLTQVYQIDEDRQRGDQSFAVRWGPEKVFASARWLVGLGVMNMLLIVHREDIFQRFWTWLFPLAYLAFWGTLHVWKRRFYQQSTYQNHDWTFGLSTAYAVAFWGFIAVEYAWRV